MSDIAVGKPTTDLAFFCPKCGSPTIQILTGLVIGGSSIDLSNPKASCSACGWNGLKRELAATPFQHEFSGSSEIGKELVLDLRKMLAAELGAVLAKFLLKWGFLDQPLDARQLARYLHSMAEGIVSSVIKERQKIVEEKARGNG